MRRITQYIALTCVLSVQPALAAEYVHPRLKSKQAAVRTVVLLPPQVAGARSGVKGSESLVAESEAAAVSLAAALGEVLRVRGLIVVPSAFDSLSSEQGESLGDDTLQTVATLQARYDSVAPQLSRRPKDVNKGRFSLSEGLADLAPDLTADALVFVRAQGVSTTKAGGFLQGGLIGMLSSGGYVTCDVAVVDSLTGDVLFFMRVNAKSKLEEAGLKLQEQLAKSFKKFPLGS